MAHAARIVAMTPEELRMAHDTTHVMPYSFHLRDIPICTYPFENFLFYRPFSSLSPVKAWCNSGNTNLLFPQQSWKWKLTMLETRLIFQEAFLREYGRNSIKRKTMPCKALHGSNASYSAPNMWKETSNKYLKHMDSGMIIHDLFAVGTFQLYHNLKISQKLFKRKNIVKLLKYDSARCGQLFCTYEASVVEPTGVSRKRVATEASISIRSLGGHCNESMWWLKTVCCFMSSDFFFATMVYFGAKRKRKYHKHDHFHSIDAFWWFQHLWTTSAKNESSYIILLLETSMLSYMQFLGAESSRNVTGDVLPVMQHFLLCRIIRDLNQDHLGTTTQTIPYRLQWCCFLNAI